MQINQSSSSLLRAAQSDPNPGQTTSEIRLTRGACSDNTTAVLVKSPPVSRVSRNGHLIFPFIFLLLSRKLWCSSMVYHYSVPLWCQLWHTFMVYHYSVPLWWTYMVYHYCVQLWWTFMVYHYGEPLWCTVIVYSYGVGVWCTFIVYHYSEPLWYTIMVNLYGVVMV
jgi:hypothetical protein